MMKSSRQLGSSDVKNASQFDHFVFYSLICIIYSLNVVISKDCQNFVLSTKISFKPHEILSHEKSEMKFALPMCIGTCPL